MGIDFIDYVTGGGDKQEYSFEEAISSDRVAQPILRLGVVTDVFYDPGAMTPEKIESLQAGDEHGLPSCVNPQFFEGVPRNSILVRDVTAGTDRTQRKSYLAYPFFPPHLSMPVKPGETVWLIDPNPQGGSNMSYWMCRVNAPDYVDDLNFTHYDRTSLESAKQTKAKTPPERPGFVNGLGGIDDYTLKDPDDYDKIFSGSMANDLQTVTYEVVPRFKKRPGDMVLQGSNNTLICLGEDRGWSIETRPLDTPGDGTLEGNLSNATIAEDFRGIIQKGTIDIVAGRGIPELGMLQDTASSFPIGTSPHFIENDRAYNEVNKNPVNFPTDPKVENNYYAKPCEGDPDFINDLSRIYVSMKTSADVNFGLTYPAIPAPGDSNDGVDVEPTDNQPSVVLKSNEIRVVARFNEEFETNGSIKIVKEGIADDEAGKGRAVIMMQPDGTVMIDGPKIVLGSGITKAPGAGTQVVLGVGATEPLVLGNALNTILNDLIAAIKAITVSTGTGPSSTPINAGDFDAIAGKLNSILSLVGKTK